MCLSVPFQAALRGWQHPLLRVACEGGFGAARNLAIGTPCPSPAPPSTWLRFHHLRGGLKLGVTSVAVQLDVTVGLAGKDGHKPCIAGF